MFSLQTPSEALNDTVTCRALALNFLLWLYIGLMLTPHALRSGLKAWLRVSVMIFLLVAHKMTQIRISMHVYTKVNVGKSIWNLLVRPPKDGKDEVLLLKFLNKSEPSVTCLKICAHTKTFRTIAATFQIACEIVIILDITSLQLSVQISGIAL